MNLAKGIYRFVRFPLVFVGIIFNLLSHHLAFCLLNSRILSSGRQKSPGIPKTIVTVLSMKGLRSTMASHFVLTIRLNGLVYLRDVCQTIAVYLVPQRDPRLRPC